jgi:hypothetical protein
MMPTHKRKHKEEDWDLILTAWFIQKGSLQGIINNLCDALDEHTFQAEALPHGVLQLHSLPDLGTSERLLVPP